MGLNFGDTAPDFVLQDQLNRTVSLKDLRANGPVVLFFYPKDMTAGCTAEACAFRDAYEEFKDAGAEVVGISSQGVESKKEFADKNRLTFPLVADEGGKVRHQFGVKKALLGIADGRETYVIDQSGKIRMVFNSLINATGHVKEAKKVIQQLKGEARAS